MAIVGRFETHLAQELVRFDLEQANDSVTHVRPELGSDEVIDLVRVEAIDVRSRDGLPGRPAEQLKSSQIGYESSGRWW